MIVSKPRFYISEPPFLICKLCLLSQSGAADPALEAALQQERKLRHEAEQKMNLLKTDLERVKQEESSLKTDIMDYERKIAKANLEIDKVKAYRIV